MDEALLAARSRLVVQHRAGQWPGGNIGAWYSPEDWTDTGELVATGEAMARAMDPWANDRASGRPCPALVLSAEGEGLQARRLATADRVRRHRQRKKDTVSPK
jgi:hypothetical protein